MKYTGRVEGLRVSESRRLRERALAIVLPACGAEVWPHAKPSSHNDLVRAVEDAYGVLVLLTDAIDAEVIASASHPRVISSCAVGVQNIGVEAATAPRVPVGNTPDVLKGATADLARGLMLSAARRIVEGSNDVRGELKASSGGGSRCHL